jgi:hypothetical protein
VGSPIQVTNGPSPASDPSWVTYTPLPGDDPPVTTQDIAYRTDELGTTYLNVIENAYLDDGTTPMLPFDGTDGVVYPLTGDPGGDASPAFSPRGDRLAYDSTSSDPAGINRDIHLMFDTSGPLTPEPDPYAPDPAEDSHPSWEGRPDCALPIPHLPTPAPVTRTDHTKRSGPSTGGATPSGQSDGGGPSGSNNGGPAPTKKTSKRLTVRLSKMRSTGHDERRRVRFTLTLNSAAKARIKLLRGRHPISNRVFRLHRGANPLTIRVPRRTRGGVYRLTIKAVGATTVRLSRRVRIPC